MGICIAHLKELVIRPTLLDFELWSESAENLLLGTAAQESQMGYFLKQNLQGQDGKGKALGIYQMEPPTHMDLWLNFLTYKKGLIRKIGSMFAYRGIHPPATEMIHNIKYATIMCRLHYLRVKDPLPDSQDILGLAKYWKKSYNTSQGKGTEEEFIENYNRYIL